MMHRAFSTGRSFLLSGGTRGPLRVFVGAPPPGELGKRVVPRQLASDLRAWMTAGTGMNYYSLVELYEALGRSVPRPPRPTDLREMADSLVDAFAREELVALERRLSDVGLRELPPDVEENPPVSEPAPPTLRDERPVTTWIEIVLVDEDGVPVPNRRFSLVLPDESVLDGVLDATGRAHVEGIDPGTCRLTFPDLDVSSFA